MTQKVSLPIVDVSRLFDKNVVFNNSKQEQLNSVCVQESKHCTLPGTGFVQMGVIAQTDIPAWNMVGTTAKLLTVRKDADHDGIEWGLAAFGIALKLKGEDVKKEGTFTHDLLSRFSSLYPRKYTKKELEKLVVESDFDAIVQWSEEIIKFNVVDTGNDEWVVFDLFSFINHSCVPNCLIIADKSKACAQIISLSKIKKGEELFTTYTFLPDHNLSDSRHRSLQTKWNVDCRCDACVVAMPHLSVTEDTVSASKKDCYKGSKWWDCLFYRTCHACGTVGDNMMSCSKCKCAMYCNKDCQKKHYKSHKVYCTDSPSGNQLFQTRLMLNAFKHMKQDVAKYRAIEKAYSQVQQI